MTYCTKLYNIGDGVLLEKDSRELFPSLRNITVLSNDEPIKFL